MSTEQETSDEPKLEVEAVGVDEIVRQERVRSIFDARKICREHRLASKRKRNPTIYRNALESYVREVEPLFNETDEGRHCWFKQNFGRVDLRPDPRDLPSGYNEITKVMDAKHAQLTGLKSLFEMGSPITHTAEVLVPSKRLGGGTTVKTVSIHREIPAQTLDQMYAVTNGFLQSMGFGIHVEKAQQNTTLDDGIMEEVEQWRAENL